MKHYRILSLILVVALCLSATTAFAAEGHQTITDLLHINSSTPSGHCDCPGSSDTDFCWKWDAASKTLTLNDLHMEKSTGFGNSGGLLILPQATLKLQGDSSIKVLGSAKASAIATAGDLTISGDGKLELYSENQAGLWVGRGYSLTLTETAELVSENNATGFSSVYVGKDMTVAQGAQLTINCLRADPALAVSETLSIEGGRTYLQGVGGVGVEANFLEMSGGYLGTLDAQLETAIQVYQTLTQNGGNIVVEGQGTGIRTQRLAVQRGTLEATGGDYALYVTNKNNGIALGDTISATDLYGNPVKPKIIDTDRMTYALADGTPAKTLSLKEPTATVPHKTIERVLHIEDTTPSGHCDCPGSSESDFCWKWDADTKTMTLKGVSMQLASTASDPGLLWLDLPQATLSLQGRSRILVADQSASLPAVYARGDLTTTGQGELVATMLNSVAMQVDGNLMLEGEAELVLSTISPTHEALLVGKTMEANENTVLELSSQNSTTTLSVAEDLIVNGGQLYFSPMQAAGSRAIFAKKLQLIEGVVSCLATNAIVVQETLTQSGGSLQANGRDRGIDTKHLTVTGGLLIALGNNEAVYATETITLGDAIVTREDVHSSPVTLKDMGSYKTFVGTDGAVTKEIILSDMRPTPKKEEEREPSKAYLAADKLAQALRMAQPGDTITVDLRGQDENKLYAFSLKGLDRTADLTVLIKWDGGELSIPAAKLPTPEQGRIYWVVDEAFAAGYQTK